jgi:tetratricopeptide (TPR) repeat protein
LAAPERELLGREAEVVALGVPRRLVTVWGPPGVGKTRLVREVFGADGHLCSLAGRSGDDEVVREVARALGLEEAGPAEVALAVARSERTVILDGARPELAALLEGWLTGGEARFVVTARSPLGLASEHAIELAPLAPDAALALLSRATRELGHACDERLAAEIVERLDRLPLALEWFAARVALLGEAACLERLRRGESEGPLALALDEAVAELPADEEEALLRLAAFEEGAPAAALDRLLDGIDLEVVDRLARRALVRLERYGPGLPRVVSYRGVQRRMRARAAACGREDELERLHAGVVLAIAPVRSELQAIVERFEARDPELALAACLALCPLAIHDGSAAALSLRLARLAGTSPRALVALGGLERALGRFDAARAHLEAALPDFAARIELAHVDRMQSRLDAALAGYEAALAQAATDAERCVALGEMGRALQSSGRLRAAQLRHEEAIALARSLGLPEREALERSLHARATHRTGAVAEAIPLHRQALGLHEAQGRARLAAAELGHLGYCHHELGDAAEAEGLFRRSIDGLAAVGDVALEGIERTLLARLLCDVGRFAEARLELALVARTTAAIDLPRVELTRRLVAGLIDAAQDDRDAARREWRAGLALGLHREVGFEALLPAHLALVDPDHADALLRESAAALARDETPGLAAAFDVLSAAARGQALPVLSPRLVATSSDVRRALHAFERAAGSAPLRVPSDGRVVALPDGSEIDLTRRAAPRRVLLALAVAREDHAGAVVSPDALIAAGWPGERLRADAGVKRLRTAIWTLRKLGLEAVLLTRDDGYLLDPRVPLRRG